MDLTMILLYILIALLTAIVYSIRHMLTYWRRRGIPHDEPHFMLGNMRGFRKTRVFQQIFDDVYYNHKGSGPFCGFYLFHRPMVFVLDKQLAKNILIKDFANFADRGIFFNERDDPLSAHLFAIEGVKWKQLRQKLSPTFTSGKMKIMFPTVVEVGKQFAQVFDEMVTQSATVEIKELLARFTTDVIGTCAFGIECNSLKDPQAEFRLKGRSVFEDQRHCDLLLGFMQSFPKLARMLRMRIITDDVHDFFLRAVRETVAYREQNHIRRNDFMDLLLEMKKRDGDADELGGLTVEEIAAQAFVFFLGGFETSSTAMGYALYELARNKDAQEQLRAEIQTVLAKHNGEFTYDSMKEMQYMDQVINETLRLYTIVPALQRIALKDYVVPGADPKYVIEKGMSVFVPSCSFHRDAEFYPDPEAFKPERFTPELVRERDAMEWLPFGDGPRICIGMRFGQIQARIGLGVFLQHFRFSFSEQTPDALKFDSKNIMVLSVEGGIYLNVERL